MDETRELAGFYNRILQQQEDQNEKRIQRLNKEIELMHERQYEQFSALEEYFQNTLQSVAELNNITISLPVDGIVSLPIIYRIEAHNSQLKSDLEFCYSENRKLSAIIDALLEREAIQPDELQVMLQAASDVDHDNQRIECLTTMTSNHYQNIIEKLENRLIRCENDNKLLANHYIVSEKRCCELEVENVKLTEQVNELKNELTGVHGAVQLEVSRIKDLLNSEKASKNQLVQNNKLLSQKLMRQMEENEAVRNDLNELAGNENAKLGVMIKIAMKQRDGEYARICSNYKTHADECKSLVNEESAEMMKKEDLLVELRLKIIELFENRDFHKEQFREEFEKEFIPIIARMQEENDKLRQSLSGGEDEALRLYDRIEFLEEIKRTITASNTSLERMKDEYESQSMQISQQFINETLTTDLLKRRLEVALEELHLSSNDRDVLLQENDSLANNYAFAVEQYGNIIKAYEVMMVDLAKRNGIEENEAVRMANQVQTKAYELVNSPLAKQIESSLQQVILTGADSIQAAKTLQKIETDGIQKFDQFSSSEELLKRKSNRTGSAVLDCAFSNVPDGGNEIIKQTFSPVPNLRQLNSATPTNYGFRRQYRAPQMQTVGTASMSEITPLTCPRTPMSAEVSNSANTPDEIVARPVKIARNEESFIFGMGPQKMQTYKLNDAEELDQKRFYQYCSLYNEVVDDAKQQSPRKIEQSSSVFANEMRLIAELVANQAPETNDEAIEVDELQICLLPVQLDGEEQARSVPEYLLKKATLLYSPEYYEKMFNDADFTKLPVASEMELLRHSNPIELKSETSDSSTQMEPELQRNPSIFTPIPRNSYSRACVTEIPNVSRTIEAAGELASRNTLRELLDLHFIEHTDQMLISDIWAQPASPEHNGDAATQTDQEAVLQKDENLPKSLSEDEKSLEWGYDSRIEYIECMDAEVEVEGDEIEQIEWAEREAEADTIRQDALRYRNEAIMLQIDLRARLKELYYLRARNSDLLQFEREYLLRACQLDGEKSSVNGSSLNIVDNGLKGVEATNAAEKLKIEGSEGSWPPELLLKDATKLLYLGSQIEAGIVPQAWRELLAQISYFERRIEAISNTAEEALAIARKRNEQVQSLLEILREFAQKGDPELEGMLKSSDMAGALLSLYRNDEQVVKNDFLQRTFLAEGAAQTSETGASGTSSGSSGPRRTNSPSAGVASKECQIRVVELRYASGGVDRPPVARSARGRSRSVQVNSVEQIPAENAKIARLIADVRTKTKLLAAQSGQIEGQKAQRAELLKQIQMLNRYFNENPRDADQDQIQALTETALFQQQRIIYLEEANARLTLQQGQAEKAMKFMFGDVAFGSNFDGCLFRTSTMRNETNLDCIARSGAEE